MRGWHFTCPLHLADILVDQELRPSESNIGGPRVMGPRGRLVYHPHGEHVGPDVVWLFDTPEPRLRNGGRMLNGHHADEQPQWNKTLVRIEVEVPVADDDHPDGAHPWTTWSADQGISKAWGRHLAEGGDPRQWFVVPRPVTRAEWVGIEQRSKADGPWFARKRLAPVL